MSAAHDVQAEGLPDAHRVDVAMGDGGLHRLSRHHDRLVALQVDAPGLGEQRQEDLGGPGRNIGDLLAVQIGGRGDMGVAPGDERVVRLARDCPQDAHVAQSGMAQRRDVGVGDDPEVHLVGGDRVERDLAVLQRVELGVDALGFEEPLLLRDDGEHRDIQPTADIELRPASALAGSQRGADDEGQHDDGGAHAPGHDFLQPGVPHGNVPLPDIRTSEQPSRRPESAREST